MYLQFLTLSLTGSESDLANSNSNSKHFVPSNCALATRVQILQHVGVAYLHFVFTITGIHLCHTWKSQQALKCSCPYTQQCQTITLHSVQKYIDSTKQRALTICRDREDDIERAVI